jgi:hypothetical protein
MRSRVWMGYIYHPHGIEILKGLDARYLLISQPYTDHQGKLEWAVLIRYNNPVHKPKFPWSHFYKANAHACNRNYVIEKGILYERGLFTVNPSSEVDRRYLKAVLERNELPQEIKVECLKRHCLPPMPVIDRTK